MVKAKKFTFGKHFEGLPKPTDFNLEEEELRPLKDGEYLAEAVYVSVDPYIRAYVWHHVLGNTVFAAQIAKIIESKHPDFPVGKHVVGRLGWRSHTIVDGNDKSPLLGGALAPFVIPDFGDLPLSLALGHLGAAGNTAYFGLFDVLQPKAGQTLVVSGAAGAVGNVVGQLGKLQGLRVIGIAGSGEKCKWLVEDLGFDSAINYKAADLKAALEAAAPEGIDLFYDNVGGEISSVVIHQMNVRGIVAVVGSISMYNTDENNRPKATVIQRPVITNRLTLKGFGVMELTYKWFEGINQLLKLTQEGKLKYRETVTKGFENIPKAFIEMLQGGNIGKAIVDVSE